MQWSDRTIRMVWRVCAIGNGSHCTFVLWVAVAALPGVALVGHRRQEDVEERGHRG